MKNTTTILIAVAASFCLGFSVRSLITKQTENNPKVVGVGGIFFKCKDSKAVREWYKTHLGFNTDQYGALFKWQEGEKKVTLQWSPFKETTKYFEPSAKDFMINYRVDDLTGLIAQLKKDNVAIVDTMETYDYGKFIHIMDPEGNKIELWEPNYAYKSK
jgi:predicted enzyme related to lactoylglutathione lyase